MRLILLVYARLRDYWSQSIRHQMALSFGLVAGSLMLGVGYLLLEQQRDFLHARDLQNATNLAHALAASSTSWVLAKDEVGLQELTRGLSQVRDLKLALVQTSRGEVLASTRTDYIGAYFSDDISLGLLDSDATPHVLLDRPNLIDVAVPVKADTRLIGWARVEMTRASSNANLRELTLWGLGFVLLTVLLAGGVAVWLARRLTSGVDHLVEVASRVGGGQDDLRAQLGARDEVGVLARQMNRMLDSIAEQKAAVNSRTSELIMHNRILQKISQGVLLPELLNDLASEIEQQYPGLRCSIYLLDAGSQCLRFCAAPSLPGFFVDALNGVRIGEGLGTSGTAAYRGKRVIVEDVGTHPFWAAFRDLARRANVGACWAQPIMGHEQEVLGTFTLYREQSATPAPAEIVLIERCAQLSALAIERDRAQADLRIAATTFESQEGKAVTDAKGVYIKVNKAFTQITGYSAHEALGKNATLLDSGVHDKEFHARVDASLQQTGGWQGEVWHKRKNGEIYPEWLTLTTVRNELGTVTHYVASFSDITQRKAAEMEIEHLAFYDPLTRLPNRRLLTDRLQQALASSERNQRQGALLFLDLDNFKTLNDTHGHDKGDLLLQQVAQRLSDCIREGDTVARLGGDEFVVMLQDLSDAPADAAANAETVGEKILATLNRPYQLPGMEQHSSVSIGITLFCGQRDTIDELFKRADLALYQAKGAGRNALRFYDPEMQAAVAARAAMEVDLREGLAQQQFLLHYQPQIDAAGRLTGAEVLVRWNHPLRGLVSPMEFIPLAEDTGLILPLGRWVLEAACRQLALWETQPHSAPLNLAVNVSARQFYQPNFKDEVLGILDSTGARPDRLKLELTESLLVADVEGMITKMQELKSWGVGFALDDFGTGYSSLSYLKRLPLDQLKIDQGFVRDALTDPNDAAIIQTIVALGHSMGLSVIAEGVETQAQRDFLARSGCYHYQGYLFGRPGPLETLDALIETLDRTPTGNGAAPA